MCPTRPRSTSPPPPVDATAHDAADVAARGDGASERPTSAAPLPRPPRLPTVALTRPRCPSCGTTRIKRYRSIKDQGDGTAVWWVQCQAPACGHRFKILFE